jgi:hypothetical protein
MVFFYQLYCLMKLKFKWRGAGVVERDGLQIHKRKLSGVQIPLTPPNSIVVLPRATVGFDSEDAPPIHNKGSKMFALLKRKFGTAAFVFPLMVLMGLIFHVEPNDILLGSIVMYIVTLALLMLDDVFVSESTGNVALLSEEELVELDRLVYPVQIKVEIQYH